MAEKKPKKDYQYTDEQLAMIAKMCPDFQSPTYQWYVNDFLGSNRVEMMDLMAVGAYRILLDKAWKEKDCGLPTNDDALAKLSRAYGFWNEIKGQILPMFFEFAGRLYSRRLLLVRNRMINIRQQRIDAANKRHGNNEEDANASLPDALRSDPPVA